jgi:predicted lipoprotein with Yx(FWY)xxD motif
MTQTVSPRRIALTIALAATALLVLSAYAGISAAARAPKGALVALRKTSLGPVLVDARGRTLYVFEKDKSGMSACTATCSKFWPPLVSRGTPHAGTGVQKSLLAVTRRSDGRRQVTYAGHPLYSFVGDKRAGQTTGEGLTNFGADWYALAASGRTVERSQPSAGGYGSGGW